APARRGARAACGEDRTVPGRVARAPAGRLPTLSGGTARLGPVGGLVLALRHSSSGFGLPRPSRPCLGRPTRLTQPWHTGGSAATVKTQSEGTGDYHVRTASVPRRGPLRYGRRRADVLPGARDRRV